MTIVPAWGARDQPWVHHDFKSSLKYRRPVPEKQKIILQFLVQLYEENSIPYIGQWKREEYFSDLLLCFDTAIKFLKGSETKAINIFKIFLFIPGVFVLFCLCQGLTMWPWLS